MDSFGLAFIGFDLVILQLFQDWTGHTTTVSSRCVHECCIRLPVFNCAVDQHEGCVVSFVCSFSAGFTTLLFEKVCEMGLPGVAFLVNHASHK